MNKIIKVFFIAMFFCVDVFGQETETAASLNLTGTALPANAHRIRREYVPTQINQALESLVSVSSGKLRRGDTEVLLWTGGDLRKTGSKAIVNCLTGSLKAEGWRYEVGGVENDITLFSLLKDGENRRALIGLFGEADGTFIFALTELHAGEVEQTNSNPATNYKENGNVFDYSFTTPAGWSRNDSADKIVLSKGGDNKIEFLPLTESSGNLERDAERIIWQVFKGYDSWYSNGFESDWGTFEKGRTAQGLEYFRVYRYIKKASEENNGFAQSKMDAIILLVKLGNKVAVIAGRQPFQSDFARDSTLAAIDLILYDLAFKSVSASYDLKKDLLGSWSAAGGSVGLAYTFNTNGTFHKGAASEFRTQINERTQKVTTTSYGMTESYSLNGNILTQNYKRTGEVVKYKIRVYYTRYDKDAWLQKLGFLPPGNSGGEALVLQRND